MSERRPLARLLLCAGLLCAAAFAVVGGLSMRAPGLVAVGLGGTLAACAAVGIARESPRSQKSPLDSAVQAGAWTVGVLLVLAGIAALAGGALAVLVAGVVAGTVVVLRVRSGRPLAAPVAAPDPLPDQPMGHGVLLLPVPPPVAAMTTQELGREWLRTTALLGGGLQAGVRQSVVQRREESLDELERRDPDGFTRWLAAGPDGGSDPADYVRGRAVPGGPAADTDAA